LTISGLYLAGIVLILAPIDTERPIEPLRPPRRFILTEALSDQRHSTVTKVLDALDVQLIARPKEAQKEAA
jgi:hypothetical protein